MKHILLVILLFSFFIFPADSFGINSNNKVATQVENATNASISHEAEISPDKGHDTHHSPGVWLVIPFVALLLMIATGPLFYEVFWHHNYPKIAIALAVLVVLYYLFVLGNTHAPVHAAFEYVQFIALLTGLFVVSGGIMIKVNKKGSPKVNAVLLIVGAIIANVIGTTGASMLLIRPFIRVNSNRIKAYHIIFFIFIISNIGGSLTPIGDPPLFLGFLKGVPFFWTLTHNILAWALGIVFLVGVFYLIDKKNKDGEDAKKVSYSGKVTIEGNKNFGWLLIIILAVFLDPNVFEWVPAIHYDGQKFSFLREIIMLSVAYISHRFSSKELLKAHGFNFEPIKEVAFIFIGIFGTMMPALELVSNFAQSPSGSQLITHNTLYWGTGLLSGFLDNAPTYLNFLAAAMASKGASINSITDVASFAHGGYPDSTLLLKSISIAAVFFGAFTYIGNGPNFMVKSIAEQLGVKMPSFFGYILRFALPFLLPLFILVWLIFFAFAPIQ